jgi:hypothetical protein
MSRYNRQLKMDIDVGSEMSWKLLDVPNTTDCRTELLRNCQISATCFGCAKQTDNEVLHC